MGRKRVYPDVPQSGEAQDSSSKSRRGFLKGSVGMVAGAAAAQLLPTAVSAQQNSAGLAGRLTSANASGRPILLKGGIVLTLDPMVGDFAKADVLMQGKKIMSVGPSLAAPGQAVVVNAAGFIVMPGFIDTHHHQYETVLRSVLADGLFGTGKDPLPKKNYSSVIQGIFTPNYLPDDARLAQLIASLSQISDGVTTTVDMSQVHLTPEHTDACIAGLKESGRRCLFGYGANGKNAAQKQVPELARLRKQYFSSDDQLLTLAVNGAPTPTMFKQARDIGAPTVSHTQGGLFDLIEVMNQKLMGPTNGYVHCTRITKAEFDAIRDTGGHVSIATAIEMQMKHGNPPFQECLNRGIRPSLSVDVECNMTADSFTQMRTTFCYQRSVINERSVEGEINLPALVTCRDVIEFATIQGARYTQLESKVGTLTPGKEADIIMLTTGLNVAPLNNVPGAIVTLMDTSNVENVFIAGKVRKWQGKLVGVDVDKVIRDVEKSCDGLMARSNYTRELFDTCCPGPWTPGGK